MHRGGFQAASMDPWAKVILYRLQTMRNPISQVARPMRNSANGGGGHDKGASLHGV